MAQQLKLKDGRIIEYLVSGAEDGFPFVWIHGTPGAYILDPSLGDICVEKGVKIITLSRAGYGGSSRDKGRRVVDAVADIQAVNDHLGIKRCLVGGWSGGGELRSLILVQRASSDFYYRTTCIGLCSKVARLCCRSMCRWNSPLRRRRPRLSSWSRRGK